MKDSRIIALDVGEKRIGVATANAAVGFPSPLTTINNNEQVWLELEKLLAAQNTIKIVVGLPRNLHGEDTKQTTYTREFIKKLSGLTSLPIEVQDEALTSKKAEEELSRKKKPYKKGDIDALAATYILEDFLATERSVRVS